MLNDGHEAFAGVEVQYASAVEGCGRCTDPNVCFDGACRHYHGTADLSRVSASGTNGPHASRAEIFFANTGATIYSWDEGRPNATWDFFRAADVQFINASHGQPANDPNFCSDIVDPTYTCSHAREDRWARLNSGLVIQAAGQVPNLCAAAATGNADCLARAALCVGAIWNNGTRSFEDDVHFTAGTLWENPADGVERPDLVADGAYATIARPDSRDGWLTVAEWPDVTDAETWCQDVVGPMNEPRETPSFSKPDPRLNSGTSFAAPVVTGLAALLNDCWRLSRGRDLEPFEARAVLRNAARPDGDLYRGFPNDHEWVHEPHAYPIAGLGLDYWAGTGRADAGALASYCRSSAGENEAGELPEDDGRVRRTAGSNVHSLRVPWESLPEWMQQQSPERLVETTLQNATESGDGPKGVATPTGLQWGASARYERQPIAAYEELPAGSRVRASISFLPCGELRNPRPASDFDLLLVAEDREEILAASIAEVDTNEGFDVVVPRDVERASVIVVRSAGLPSGCDDENDPWIRAGVEPYGYAVEMTLPER